jgi:hypothetical protein
VLGGELGRDGNGTRDHPQSRAPPDQRVMSR